MSKKEDAKAGGDVEVRVLSDCRFGSCGKLGVVSADELAEAKALGLVDDHPNAVAFAKAEG